MDKESAGDTTGVSVGVDSGVVGESVTPSAVVIPTKMPDGTVIGGSVSDGRSLVMAGMTVRGRPSVEPGRSEGNGKDGRRVVSRRPPVPEEPIIKGPSIVEDASPLVATAGAEASGVGLGGIIVSGSPLEEPMGDSDGDGEASGTAVGALVGSKGGSVGSSVVNGRPPVEPTSVSAGTLRVSGLSEGTAGSLEVGGALELGVTIMGGRGPPVRPRLGSSDGSSEGSSIGREGSPLLGRSTFGGETGSAAVVDGSALASVVSAGDVVGTGNTTGEFETGGVVSALVAGLLGIVDDAGCGGENNDSINDSRSGLLDDCRVSSSDELSGAGGDGVGAAGCVPFVTIWRLI